MMIDVIIHLGATFVQHQDLLKKAYQTAGITHATATLYEKAAA